MGFRLPNLSALYKAMECNLFVLSYRGYGGSDGTPSEDGLILDAESVLDYLHDRVDVDSSKIILFGRSLGGAVAIALASRHPQKVAGTIVENTFTSMSDMVDNRT